MQFARAVMCDQFKSLTYEMDNEILPSPPVSSAHKNVPSVIATRHNISLFSWHGNKGPFKTILMEH